MYFGPVLMNTLFAVYSTSAYLMYMLT